MLDLLISYINWLILSIPSIVKKFTFKPPNPPKYKLRKNILNNEEEILFYFKPKHKKLDYWKIDSNYLDVKFITIKDTNYNKNIPILIISPKFENNRCIIYCQGNSGDLGTSLLECHEIASNCKATVVTFEYPGYGLCKNETIEESEFYNRIKIIYMYIINEMNYYPHRIFLYGFSLGTGIVFDFACKKEYPVAGLILQSPFLSILRIIYNTKKTKYFDLFNNCDKAKYLCTKTLILHGDNDKTVPYIHGRILEKLIPKKFSYNFLTVREADHNNLLKDFKDEAFFYINSFISESISAAKANVKFNNYLPKITNKNKKIYQIESENQDLNNIIETKDKNIFRNKINKANTYVNFKLNNIYNNNDRLQKTKEIQKNGNDTNNLKSSYNLKTNTLQELTRNEDYISKLSTSNNNINKVKNINDKNNKYYYVNIGTSSELMHNNIYMPYNHVNKNKINDKYNFGKYNNINYINSSNTNLNNN